MDLSPLSLVLIALVLAAWAVGAAIVVLRANQSVKRVKAMRTSLKRMQTLLDVAPALPLLVRVDGRIEAPEKLARMLGLSTMPKYLSELTAPAGNPTGGGLAQAQLGQGERAAATRARFASVAGGGSADLLRLATALPGIPAAPADVPAAAGSFAAGIRAALDRLAAEPAATIRSADGRSGRPG